MEEAAQVGLTMGKKSKNEKAGAGFMSAPEVYEVARTVMQTVDEHHDLAETEILYIFTRKPITEGGEKVPFTVAKLGGRNAYLASGRFKEGQWTAPEPQFLVVVYRDAWLLMTKEMQEACVDSILCRFNVETLDDGGRRLKLERPDVQEFTSVIARRGQNWMPETLMAQAISGQPQLALNDSAAKDELPAPAPKSRRQTAESGGAHAQA